MRNIILDIVFDTAVGEDKLPSYKIGEYLFLCIIFIHVKKNNTVY